MTAIQSLGEATTLALNDANCNFESPDGTRFANLDSVDTATLQTLYFSTDAEAASVDENFGTVSAPVACSISSGTFTCNGQTAADAPLNAFVICNNANTGAVSSSALLRRFPRCPRLTRPFVLTPRRNSSAWLPRISRALSTAAHPSPSLPWLPRLCSGSARALVRHDDDTPRSLAPSPFGWFCGLGWHFFESY